MTYDEPPPTPDLLAMAVGAEADKRVADQCLRLGPILTRADGCVGAASLVEELFDEKLDLATRIFKGARWLRNHRDDETWPERAKEWGGWYATYYLLTTALDRYTAECGADR